MKSTILTFLIVFTAGRLLAADPLFSFNDFDDGSVGGWTSSAPAKISLDNSAGKLAVQLASQTVPAFVDESVVLPLAAGSAVTNIAFSLDALDVAPSRMRLQFHSAVNGHLWHLQLPVPQAGQRLTVNSALDYSEGWSMGAPADAVLFSNDVQSVDWIGIRIRRNADIAAQTFAVDNFIIRGLFYIKDSDGDGMADDWETAHGFSTNDVNDANADSDGDGIINYAEYRAGSNPHDAASYFIARAGRKNTAEHGFVLQWPSIENRTYSIWRSQKISAGFVKIASGIHAAPPRNIFEDPDPVTGAAFYRIEIDPEITP